MDCKPFPFTQAYLRSRLHYNRTTGMFTWKYSASLPVCWNGRYAGTEAGTLQNGYLHILIEGRRYLAHRLAWFYTYGEQPDEVDHRDLDGSHNWLDNLRDATREQNQHNRPANRTNTSGFKGVTRHGKVWRARIRLENDLINLGTYSSPEAASKVYIRAAKKYHKNYARWGVSEKEVLHVAN